MLTADVQINEFNRGINRLVNQIGLNAKYVVHKEVGELIKTLVKISPPRDRNKAMAKTRDTVMRRFELVGLEVHPAFHTGKISSTGIEWYSVDRNWLKGMAPENDMRKASTLELRKVYYSTTKRGNLKKDFQHPRASQRVLLTQKIVTTKKQAAAVAKKIVGNYGRLKAGWLKAVFSGVISLGGKFMPPAWVTKHREGARGRFINGLSVPGNPHFEIANFAKGVTHRNSTYWTNQAVKIRAKAMAANAKLILAGKKDYTY